MSDPMVYLRPFKDPHTGETLYRPAERPRCCGKEARYVVPVPFWHCDDGAHYVACQHGTPRGEDCDFCDEAAAAPPPVPAETPRLTSTAQEWVVSKACRAGRPELCELKSCAADHRVAAPAETGRPAREVAHAATCCEGLLGQTRNGPTHDADHDGICDRVTEAIEADRASRRPAETGDVVAAVLAEECPDCYGGKPGKPCGELDEPVFCRGRIRTALASPVPGEDGKDKDSSTLPSSPPAEQKETP